MKFLLLALALILSSQAYSQCLITTSKSKVLQDIVEQENGFQIGQGYEEMCKKLNNSNIGLSIEQISEITKYQTTVVTLIKGFPIEKEKKYGFKFLTGSGANSIAYDIEKTSKKEKELMYLGVNHAFKILIESQEIDKIIEEVNKMRE
ncbi:hypothetical protein ACLIL3_010765 [Acinetobacter radioresistens]|uniref:hypothetical protein n=1 Tax=Acinetobacter radioresistens TaxID=40216 RepID=UPI0021CD3554|nr:hypothetical protein [Acinetobacter radioresistens]MCU4596850.1 hypothetical protein [Acinetobacter radioresistens]